jgi:HEAT repeat protein
MSRTLTGLACLAALALAGAPAPGQDDKRSSPGPEAKLIAVIRSDAAIKAKADACTELARIGTKESVAPLAALLGDEKLNHLARYGLEPNPDPSVDESFRDALGKLKGRPLVGVIGSVGVRRDTRAVGPLSGLLKDSDPEVAQAAARALGRIGNPAAAEVLEGALDSAPANNRAGLYEGLFRCADYLAAHGQRDQALAALDKLNQPQAPSQVREGASRKARMLRMVPAKGL